MKFGINTLDDFQFRGKTVLCRLDLNSPLDSESGALKDTSRIRRSLPTIKELSDLGAKTVLLTHQGGDLEYKNYGSTEPHSRVIAEALQRPVHFIDDICGPAAREAVAGLQDGQILMLDNVRYLGEELTLFETRLNLSFKEQARTLLVKKLSPLADLFVLDAFAAAHRSQPSITGLPEVLPAAMGRLFEEEMKMLTQVVQNPRRPCVFILGGAKIEDAFDIMSVVLKDNVADLVLTGGLVASVFLLAGGAEPGPTTVEYIRNHNLTGCVERAREVLAVWTEQIIMPLDYAYMAAGVRREIDAKILPAPGLLADIGSRTAKMYQEYISKAGTIFINGPMGIFEKQDTAFGTREVWQAVSTAAGFSVLGGGDSIRAANEFCNGKGFSYISTAGGGLVKFLGGKELPAIASLRRSAARFSLSALPFADGEQI